MLGGLGSGSIRWRLGSRAWSGGAAGASASFARGRPNPVARSGRGVDQSLVGAAAGFASKNSRTASRWRGATRRVKLVWVPSVPKVPTPAA